MSKYLITKKSGNRKVGPIMVTTSSRETCPDACPFKGQGCYADGGPLRGLWDKLTATDAGATFKSGKANIAVQSHEALLEAIKEQPEGSLWRHNQAGDLPGQGDEIDLFALMDIVEANKGRNGFTYTHKPVLEHRYDTARFLEAGERVQVTQGTAHHHVAEGNRKAVTFANEHGFTINLSANNPEHADQLADLEAGPVVTVVASDQMDNTTTPKGRAIVICPVVTGKAESCATCKLCAKANRKTIVGFPAHGAAKRKAERSMNDFIAA